jgi:hypothetical protein
MPTDLSKVDTDEPKGSSLKIKVFGRRRTAEISALKEQPKFAPTQYQNVKSAVAFILVVVAMVGLCGYTAVGLDTSKARSGGLSSLWTHTATVCSCIGLGLPLVWFILLCVATAPIYYFSVFGTPALMLGIGGWAIKSGFMIPGAIDIVVALLWLAYIVWNWKRVVFTKELVRISCGCLLKHPALIGFGVLQFLVSCVWSTICFIGIVGLAVKIGSPEEPYWNGSFPLLLPYFWGTAVIGNVYVVVCGSTLAKVYFSHEENMAASVKNAMTYSFGSICLGALLIAIVQTLQFICEYLESAAREDGNVVGMILAGCLSCFMDILEWLVQIFNKYTMAIVSIYHMSFENSGYEACSLIYENGMQVLTQDVMTGFVSFIGMLLVGGSTFVIGWKFLLPDPTPTKNIYGVVIGTVLAVLLWSILMYAVDSLITTLLVCYCEDPEPMANLSKEISGAFDEKKKLLLEEQEKEEAAKDPA